MLLKNTFEMQIMKNDNDGISLKPLNDQIKLKASDSFGGCTLLDSFGYWSDNNQLYVDDSYRLIINFNYGKGVDKQILSLIEMELIGGKQQAVCFTINGVTSISSSILEARKDLNTMLMGTLEQTN